MQIIKDYLKEKGIYQRVDFDDKLVHIIKALKAKPIEYEDGSDGLRLLVKEDEELRIITAPSILLELQNCEEGDVYKIQMKYRTIGGKPIRT